MLFLKIEDLRKSKLLKRVVMILGEICSKTLKRNLSDVLSDAELARNFAEKLKDEFD